MKKKAASASDINKVVPTTASSSSAATTMSGKATSKPSKTTATTTTSSSPPPTNNESSRSTLWFNVIRFSALTLPFIFLAYITILYIQYNQLPPYEADPYFDHQLYLLTKKNVSASLEQLTSLDKHMKQHQVNELKIVEDSERFLSSDSSSYLYERVKYSENYKEEGVNGIVIFVHNIGSHQGSIIDDSEETDWIERSLILKNRFVIYRYDMRGHGKSSGPRCFISSATTNLTAFEYLNDFHQVVGERIENLKKRLEIAHVPLIVISEALGSLIPLYYETSSYPNKCKVDGLAFISLPSITSTQYSMDEHHSFDKPTGRIIQPLKEVIMRMTAFHTPSYPARGLLPPLNYTTQVGKRIKKLTSDKLRYSGAAIFGETQLYNLINSYIHFSTYEQVHKSVRSDPKYSIKGVGGVELAVNPEMWTITTARTVLDLIDMVNQGDSIMNLRNPNVLFLHGAYDYVTPIANLKRFEYLSKRHCPNCKRKVIDYDKSMLDLLNDVQAEKVRLDIENWLNQIFVK